MTTKPYNGQAVAGPKAKPGRPEEMTGGKRHSIYLDDASWAIADSLGKGNASQGIRIAIRHYIEAGHALHNDARQTNA